jgi:hypothetical protein
MLQRLEIRNELSTSVERREKELLGRGFSAVDEAVALDEIRPNEFRKFSYADGGSVAYVIDWYEPD